MRKLRPREGQRLAQGHTAKTDWMPGSPVPTLFKNFVQDELSQLPNSSVLKTIFFRLPQTPIVFLCVLPHHLLQSEPLSFDPRIRVPSLLLCQDRGVFVLIPLLALGTQQSESRYPSSPKGPRSPDLQPLLPLGTHKSWTPPHSWQGIWTPSLYLPLSPGVHPSTPSLTGAPMAGSEDLGLREDTLRVLAAFLRRGDTARSPIPNPPR